MNKKAMLRRAAELLDDLDNNLIVELKQIKSAINYLVQRADSTPEDQYLQEMSVLSEQGVRITARRLEVDEVIKWLSRERNQ